MRKILPYLLSLSVMILCYLSINAQSGVLDPNDTDVVFTASNRPAIPAYGPLSKWGHTNRLTWGNQRPFAYGYKSYYYKGMAFRLKFPKSYQHNVNDGKKYPVFFFLHGLGERGDLYDNEYQLLHGGQQHANKVDDGTFDGFLIYTQSQNGFHNNYFDKISELIDTLVKYVKADIDRVVLSGLSSGGQSTWDFMGSYYKDFAAALPISASQEEDKPTFSNFVTVPIWTANGGLDNNPDPATVTSIVNYFRSLGGNIRQTFYPDQGHGVWDSFWDQPEYFPILKTFHKANPLVYFGRTEFCPGDPVSVRMGVQAGFSAYEWQFSSNGTTWTTISAATGAEYTASQYGQYRARFKRTSASAWSDWSPAPVVVTQKAPTVTPPIQVSGLNSIVLPAGNGATTTPLTVPNANKYISFEWRRVSDNAVVGNTAIYNAPVGQYKVQVNEQYGCSSSFSAPFTVVSANGVNKPDKPSNLVAAATSNSSVHLDWSDNPNPAYNETGFEIYRSGTAGGPYSLIAITAPDVLSFDNTGLNPNTSYYYIIRAVNATAASQPTAEAGVKTVSDTQKPTAPANLRVTGTTRYSVALAWDPSSDDVGVVMYDVFVNGTKAYSTKETEFAVYNLTKGQTYAFYIKARDLSGNLSPASNQVTAVPLLNGINYKYYTFTGNWANLPDFTTLSPEYTGNTPNIDISPRNQEDNFAFLWEGAINITVAGTYYFRTNSDDGSRLWLGARNGTTSPYSFSGTPLVNNDGQHGSQDKTSSAITLQVGTYPIAIAFFEQGGGQSMTVSWRTPSTGSSYVAIPSSAFKDAEPVLTAPATPSALQVTPVAYNKINLSWTDNSSNETGFEIWRSQNATDGYITVGTTPANAVSFTDSNSVAAATTYYYKIRAVGMTGESDFIPSYDIQANWKFNNNYTDASGKGRTLTGNNTPAFNTTDKKEGTHAVDLNGTNEDITINTTSGDYIRGGYSTKTIAFWMRSDVSNSNRGILDLGGSDDGLAIRLNANQIIAGVASNNTRASISANYSSTAWNHIALVYNTNTLRLYVNGTQVAVNSSPFSFSSIGTTTDASMIGDDNGTDALNTTFGQFDGRFDDFWVFGDALSQADITRLMNATFSIYASATTPALPAAPAAPSALLASAASTSSINLSWTDNSTNETGFEIWRSVNANNGYRLLTTVASNTSTYSDQGLFANVVYYYKILAKGVGGNSAFSNEIAASTKNNLPVLVDISSFTMRFDSQKTINIAATDADGENITILAPGLPAFATMQNTGNGTAQISFTPSVTQQGSYPIRIIANDTHAGADTVDFTLTVNSNYSPVITPIANATLNEGAQLAINLAANDPDGNASLQWLSTGLPAFASIIPGTNGTATLQLAPNFAQAGSYPVTVSVTDGAGSTESATFNVTVNNVELTTNKWYVNIQYNQLPGGNSPWNNINTINGGTNLKDQNNVATPVSLQFLTTAWNVYNGGAVTNNNTGVYPDNVLRDYYYFGIFGAPETVDFRISGLEPGYKYNLSLMAGSSWTGVADNGTTVFTIGGVSKSQYTQNNTQNTVNFTSLSADANGYITVTMSKAAGTQVGYLNAFVLEKIVDDGTAPALATNLVANNEGNTGVKLSWNDIAYNELRYEVYRATAVNGTYTLVNPGAVNNNTTQYIDTTVKGLTTYYYKVAAVNNYGTATTEPVSITTLNKAPQVNTLNNVYVKSGSTASLTVTATDDAGETLSTTVSGLPSFATLINGSNGNATININPGASDLGIYKDITVTVTDNAGLATQRSFDIFVSDNEVRSVYINMAGEFGTPQGKPWNDFTAYPFAGLALNNLKDDQDAVTNYAFTIVDGWTGSWQGGMITGNNSGIYPDNVLKTSIYDATTTTKRVRFSNLDPAKKYNIAVFAGNNAGFDASFTLSSGTQSLVFNARYNSTRTAQLNGISPNASGIIEFSMTKAATATYLFLNAVVLQEYATISAAPVRPIELFTEINTPGKINLSWSDRSSNETAFQIWRATAQADFTLLTTTAAGITTYTDNSAATNTRYFYKVRAMNGTNASSYSNTATAKLGNSTVLLNLNLATPQGSPWNNTNTTPQEGAGVDNMINTEGNTTGYSMALTNNWGGYFDLGMTGGGILPDNVMLTSWWIEGNSTPGTFKLYNLDQSKRYRIGFMGSSSWEGDFTASYTINNTTVYLNSHKNNSKIVYIDNIQPNNNGEINVTMGYLNSTRWSFLSAVIIETYDYDNGASLANGNPIARAGDDQVIHLPENQAQIDGSLSEDPNGTIVSYTWSKLSGSPAQFTISSTTVANPIISNLVQGTYKLGLTVTDNSGLTSKDTVVVIVNNPPVANAGNDATITLPNNSVQLNGSSSTDSDGTITAYKWTKASGPAQFTLSNAAIVNPVLSNLTSGTYTFELEVTDNNGGTGKDLVVITVNGSTNQAPVSNAGTDININLPVNSVQVNGSASSDPDGTIVSYIWSKTSGPAQFNISNASAINPVISNLVAGTYNFQLQVTDNNGATATDIVTITVNAQPVANAGNDVVITLPVNSTQLNGSASSDPDGTIASYLWSKTSGPTQYSISSASAVNPTISNLVAGTYNFQLQVTDNNGGINTDIVIVTVNAFVNQSPISNAGSDVVITLPVNSTQLNGSASSDPDGTIASYLWSKTSGPAQYSISSTSAANPTISNLVAGTYNFQLQVTDNNGATATDIVVITVNQSPVSNAGTDVVITLPVNSTQLNGLASSDPDGTIASYLWSKTSGPAQYSISSASAANPTISNLVAGTYNFQLQVTDNNGATATDIVVITVNQSPVSNAGADVAITLPVNSTQLNGSASSDPDGTIAAYQWSKTSGPAQYSISALSIANPTISNLVAGTYNFQLQVTDNNGATATDIVIITVNPATPVNQSPVSNAGSDVVITLPVNSTQLNGSASSDPDGTIASYLWSKTSGPAQYSISSTSAVNPTISNLVAGTYNFQLQVTDNNGATATDIVIITVNPAANQSPVANAGADQSITLPASSVSLSGSASSDPDGSVVAYLWTIVSTPAGAPAPVIGTSTSVNTSVSNLVQQGSYRFQLQVTDNSGATNTDQVDITVLPQPASGATKFIKVNVYGGTNPYNSAGWFNWSVPTGEASNITSSNFNYDDNTASSISAVLNFTQGVSDNGATYGGTMCPPQVLRYGSFGTGNRTLTIRGLNNALKYDLEFYASRGNTGNSTQFTINGVTVTVNTSNNLATKAAFTDISPVNGQIVIAIAKVGTYNYLNGFMITEKSAVTQNRASNIVSQQTTAITSTQEEATKAGIGVYPNPFKSDVQLRITNNYIGKVGVTVIDAAGRTVKQLELAKSSQQLSQSLPLRALQNGVYFLRIQTGEKRYSVKVLKLE